MSPSVLPRVLAVPLLILLSLGLTFAIHAINEELEEAQRRSPLGGLNQEITDLAFQVRPDTEQDSLWALGDVVVIDIDEASIRQLGRVQLWPRSFTARVVEHVRKGEPAAIGLDVLYTEPDTLSSHYAELLRDRGFERTDRILAAMSTDDRLARSLRRAGNAYLGFYDNPDAETTVPPDSAAQLLRVARDSSAAAQSFAPLDHPVLPIPSLRRAARGIAPINFPSTGGTTRFYRAAYRLPASDREAVLVPSFAVHVAADVLEVPISAIHVGDRAVHLGTARTIPVDADGRFRVNWLGGNESIRRISYYKVLRGLVPSGFFEDKVIFLGGSAVGLEDLKSTPVAERKPGVLVHAEAFLNVMNRAHLAEWTIWDLWPWLALAAVPFLALILAVEPLYASVLTLALGAVEFFGYLLYLFPTYDTVLPVGTVLLFTLLTFVAGIVYKYVTEEWEKQKLREAFESYVSESVVEQVTDRPDALELGGEKKRLTVLFSDVRGFTTYSEHLDPQEVVTFLNRFFDRLTEAVFEQDGTVDKFIGDGMMAFFGAPLELENHATRACAAALAMEQALKELNDAKDLGSTESERPVAIGVGINTGEMVAGNIGSSRRFEYTVVGDAVNLAARLEPLNRLLGTNILLSEATYRDVTVGNGPPANWSFRELGAFRVKGRERPVTLYELMDPLTYVKADALCDQFEAALARYHEHAFADARAAFEECRTMHPGDGPSTFYIERCQRLEEVSTRPSAVIDLRSTGS